MKKSRAACELSQTRWGFVAPPPSTAVQIRVVGVPRPSASGRLVELKAVPFEPAFVGQINAYLSAVEDQLRHRHDRRSIGLLLCRDRDSVVVEYALRGLARPVGVGDWETHLTARLPKALARSLPSIAEIEAELARPAGSPGPSKGRAVEPQLPPPARKA